MSENTNQKKNRSLRGSVLDVVFASVLFLFPFLHVGTGIDVTDSAYNLLNFTVFPHMNQTWAISTILANITGHVLTKLPFGHTMLGMEIFCMILCNAFVVAFYFLLKKYYPSYVVFTGLLLAQGFAWCPRVILYHYLSYYLFGMGVIILLNGIKTGKKKWYFIAGAVLALNVFARFPNIVECTLIVVLFLYGILARKHIWKEFLLCIAGYLAMLLLGVGILSLCFGIHSYPDMIHSLFGMTSEATSYAPKAMLKTIFGDYARYIKPLLPILGLAVIGAPILAFVKKLPGKIITIICMGLAFGGIMRVLYYFGFINFNFIDYRSIYMWGTFVLMMAIFFSVFNLFRKNVSTERKLFGVSVLVIIFITPIGSNNGLYTALNNLYFVAPFVIGELLSGFDKKGLSDIKAGKCTRLWWGEASFRAVGLMVAVMALVTGLCFGTEFIFRDESFIRGDFTAVNDNPVLKGCRTGVSNAADLQEVNDYLNQNALKHKKAISYGFIPGMYYFFEEECVLTHSWPGLDSFPMEELKRDLKNVAEGNELPVFFYSGEFPNLTECNLEDLENEKQKVFAGFLREQGYEEVLRNSRYVICLPKKAEGNSEEN